MADMIKILCVDDERNVLKSLRRLFMDEDDYDIIVAESGEEGLTVLEEEQDIHLVISDYRMPGMTGVEFLAQVCEKWPDTIRIVLSGYADTAAVVEAINLGQIYKFIPKPWNDEELKTAVSTALQHRALQLQNKRLNDELQNKNQQLEEINENLENLVDKRTEALEVRNRVLQVSQGVLDVLKVAVFGIDAEGTIVQCNESAHNLFPYGILGPLANSRNDVFTPEINQLIEQVDKADNEGREMMISGSKYWVETKRLKEPHTNGIVLEMIPRELS